MDRLVLVLTLSYLIGSLPFSQIVGRLAKGIDLRKVGSGNVGGNNLMANAGVLWGLLGGGLDVLKGVSAMWLAESLGVPYPARLIAGLVSVAGHNWSVWLGFRGGKGLATAFGVLAWLAWPEALVCAGLWALLHWVTGNGNTGTAVAFVALWILSRLTGRPGELSSLGLGLFALVFLASFSDLSKANKAASHWTENFFTPKSKRQKSKA
jgi:glycerol-3-phosphate acyltransferase PlsY